LLALFLATSLSLNPPILIEEGYIEEYGDEEVAHEIIKADHEDALKSGRKPIVILPHQSRSRSRF
jgi:hypothetical protein